MKNNNKIFILSVIIISFTAIIFQFWLGFPGYFQNFDNIYILLESINNSYSHWHPVIIGKTLNILYKIFGMHTYYIFLINLICWYSGLALLISGLYLKYNKKRVISLFLLTCIANIFFQNFTHLKDITFTMYMWLAYSIILFQILVKFNKNWINISLKVITAIVLLFALLWRHNGIVTIYPIFLYFVYLALKRFNITSVKKYLLIYSAVMLIIAISLVAIVRLHPYIWIEKDKIARDVSRHTFMHKIAAISVSENDNTLIPQNWYAEGKTFNDVMKLFNANPYFADVFANSSIFNYNNMTNLKDIFIKSVIKHPVSFFKHSVDFSFSAWTQGPDWMIILDRNTLQSRNIHPFDKDMLISNFKENERSVQLSPLRSNIYDFLRKTFIKLNTSVSVIISIIIFFSSGFILLLKKSKRNDLLLFTFSTAFSAFATAIIVGIFSPVLDNRYMSPVLVIAIISLIAFIIYILNIKNKNKKEQVMKETILDSLLRKLRRNRVKKSIINYKNCRLLDIGCGWEAKLLKDLEPYIAKGVGIDFKAPMIKSDKITTFEYIMDKNLPFNDNEFDVVTMLAVLEHIENPLDIVKEAIRVLGAGGILLLTVPSKLSKPVLEFLSYKLHIIDENEIRDHKKYYNKKDLYEMVSDISKTYSGVRIYSHKYFQLGMNNFCIIKKD